MADTKVKDSEKATMYTQVLIIIAALAALVALATYLPQPQATPSLQQSTGGQQEQTQEAAPQP